MKYDAIFRGPNRSKLMKKVDGYVQYDKRVKMYSKLIDTKQKLENF